MKQPYRNINAYMVSMQYIFSFKHPTASDKLTAFLVSLRYSKLVDGKRKANDKPETRKRQEISAQLYRTWNIITFSSTIVN